MAHLAEEHVLVLVDLLLLGDVCGTSDDEPWSTIGIAFQQHVAGVEPAPVAVLVAKPEFPGERLAGADRLEPLSVGWKPRRVIRMKETLPLARIGRAAEQFAQPA